MGSVRGWEGGVCWSEGLRGGFEGFVAEGGAGGGGGRKVWMGRSGVVVEGGGYCRGKGWVMLMSPGREELRQCGH